ncbi:MAG: hypothetical protein HEP80_10025 [Dolichospermum sp. UKL201]|jgi:hypothetical protein|uniref:hypothetical protein n=1 Tax=Anabaena sp. AL09 TaxID=1710891 RepID=UPI001AF9EEA6|nr:hypothetical protein [Anabaena sp. AL09]QSV54163.1 MAG: hypothetical protein HEP80_10025 [Dolichospermum sp. UKL201]
MEYSYKTENGNLFDIIAQSPEMEIVRYLLVLQASFRLFDGNYHELIQYLDYAHKQSENQEALIDETSRLLHNFLASAGSLVEHTRVIIRKLYSNHEFKDVYQKKLQEDLGNNHERNLIQNLRNYTLHEKLPILDLQNSFSDNLLFSIQIDVKTLKESEYWKPWEDSEDYLNKLEDSTKLEDLVKKYYELIINFYTWLTEKQHNIHKADIEKLQKMKKGIM